MIEDRQLVDILLRHGIERVGGWRFGGDMM